MDNDGGVEFGDGVAIVPAQPTAGPAAFVGDMVLVLRDMRPAGAAGVDAAGVGLLPMVHPASEPLLVFGAVRLVAVSHHDERGMVAVGTQNPLPFAIKPLVLRESAANRGPGRAFDMIVETEFVGGRKGGFGRAEGVEPDVIQPVGFANADDPLPGFNVGRRVTGQGKDATLERAAKERLAAVDGDKLVGRGGNLAQTESDSFGVPFVQRGFEPVKARSEFIPGGCVVSQLEVAGENAAGGVPGNVQGHTF